MKKNDYVVNDIIIENDNNNRAHLISYAEKLKNFKSQDKNNKKNN